MQDSFACTSAKLKVTGEDGFQPVPRTSSIRSVNWQISISNYLEDYPYTYWDIEDYTFGDSVRRPFKIVDFRDNINLISCPTHSQKIFSYQEINQKVTIFVIQTQSFTVHVIIIVVGSVLKIDFTCTSGFDDKEWIMSSATKCQN